MWAKVVKAAESTSPIVGMATARAQRREHSAFPRLGTVPMTSHVAYNRKHTVTAILTEYRNLLLLSWDAHAN